MLKLSLPALFVALVACFALPFAAVAQSADSKDEKSADDEIDDIIGPTYAETMTVTATRKETSIINAPVSISVVGERELETTPAENYADLLRGVPGVTALQASAREVHIKSRGAASTLETAQLTLIDGRSVYLDFFGFVAWDLLPSTFDEIEQIEILRGPASAVWGANALNGVINIRTKSPRDLQGGYFSVLGGEIDTFGAKIRWADAPSDTFSYKLSASWYEQSEWERPTTLPGPDFRYGTPDDTAFPVSTQFVNTGTEQPKVDLRFDWETGEDETLSFKVGAAGSSGIIHTGIGPFQMDDDTWNGYLELNYDTPHWDIKFFNNILDGQGVNLLNALNFDFETELYALQANGRAALGDHNYLLFGADVRLNEFDLSIAPLDDRRTEWGVYVEDQIIFNDHVHWNVGARLDHFDTIGYTFSPRTSLILKPNENHSFRIAYNQAYRAPSLVNNSLFTVIPNAVTSPLFPDPPFADNTIIFPTTAVGNPDLEEESVDAFEIGWTGQVSDRVTITAAVYHNTTKDVIDFAPVEFYSPTDPPPLLDPATGMVIGLLPGMFVPPDTFPKTFSYRNVGEVRDRGFELGVNVDFSSIWSGSFSYTWQDEPKVTDPTNSGLALGIPSENSFSAGVNWNHPKYFGSFGVTYTDEAFWTDVLDARFWGYTDDYTLVNASVGFRFMDGDLELILAGTNLFDEDAQQHVFGDIIGRKITGEVRVRW
jgi:iron complex outermembrane receptor protein